MKFINVQRSVKLFLELSDIFIDIFKLKKVEFDRPGERSPE